MSDKAFDFDVVSFDKDGFTLLVSGPSGTFEMPDVTIGYIASRPLTRREMIAYYIRHPLEFVKVKLLRRGFDHEWNCPERYQKYTGEVKCGFQPDAVIIYSHSQQTDD